MLTEGLYLRIEDVEAVNNFNISFIDKDIVEMGTGG